MNASDLLYLKLHGHDIGNHTKSHRRLSDLQATDACDEIVLGAQEIEELIPCDLRCFAWPFGNIKSINQSSIELALQRHELLFSGIRGKNCFVSSSQILFRDAIDPCCPPTAVASILNGALDFKYIWASKLMRQYKSGIPRESL